MPPASRIEALEFSCRVLMANLETARKTAEDFNNTLVALNKRVTALDKRTEKDTTDGDNVAGVAALGA
jgi:hypothetical protein